MLPTPFLERMKELLGDEYPLFLESFSSPDVRGVRVNTLKCDKEKYIRNTSLPLSKIEYTEYGYILEGDAPVGTLPEHHAGIIYMQDPGAMMPLSAVDIPEGAKVVDLCAAPGGKSGQAAQYIGEGGFLLANEYVPKRAKIIVSNFERLGIKNAIVTSLDTSELARLYDCYFDAAICDVPCSGEGMFRKNPEAISEWCESLPESCAVRGLMILENAIRLTRRGGLIIYSSCTYSLPENEGVIKRVLDKYPELELIPLKDEIVNVTSDGINPYGEGYEILKRCRRFYPHRSEGEGQFLAVLRKNFGDMPTILYKGQQKPLSRGEMEIVKGFFSDTLTAEPSGDVCRVGENIVLIPHGVAVPPKSVFLAGVLIGEIKGNILTPSHQFFSAYGELFKRKYELFEKECELTAYLHGEELSYPDMGERGFIALTYLGATIGGGKVVGGRVKNYYPKGLRNK